MCYQRWGGWVRNRTGSTIEALTIEIGNRRASCCRCCRRLIANCQWRELRGDCFILVVHHHFLGQCNCQGLMETKAGTVMFICINISQNGGKKFRFMSFVGQIPAQWLTKLKEKQDAMNWLVLHFTSILNELFKCGCVTHSMPSIKGVSGQSFSGKRWIILPQVNGVLLFAVPENNSTLKYKT